MKIRQWIAVILVISLLPGPFAFGEELQDQVEPVPVGSDVSDEIVSSEAPEKDNARENFPETPSGLPEESMIFVFETTGQDEKTSIEAEKMTEVTEAEAAVQAEAAVITEEEEAADEESVEMIEPEAPEPDEGKNESEELEPETVMPGEKTSETKEVETLESDEASAVSEEPEAETGMNVPAEEPMGASEQENIEANESPAIPEETETEAENTVLTGIAEEKLLDDKTGNRGLSAEISELVITPVETNNRYSQMTFSFTAEGREYSCLVTGLAETGSNSEAAWQQLAEDIAESFLAGKIFTLSETDAEAQYDLKLDLIDAEKTSKWGTDSNICWAASTADMLEYTGWNKAENEDAAFQEFREEFNNRGGYQSMGISWYLNGINPYQVSFSGSGNVAYGQNLDGAAQQQHADTAGYWKDYAAAEVSEEYDESLTERLEEALDRLSEGYGVGLGSYFYRDQETTIAGHALTVFGYVREKLGEAVAAIRALFISDSDDRANGTQTNASAYPDEYVMYRTACFENSNMSSMQLEDYNTSYKTVIGIVSTLAPQKTAKPETDGTKDAIQDANLIPTAVRIENADGTELLDTMPGTTISVGSEFKNQSYRSLPKNATIRYMVKIFRDGALVDEVEKSVKTDSFRGLRPNNSIEDSLQVTLDKNGEYNFETRIIEIITAEGEPIPEAYISDNLYCGTTRLKVSGRAGESQQGEETTGDSQEQLSVHSETIQAKNSHASEKPKDTGEVIHTLTVMLATGMEYVLNFEAATAITKQSIRIQNRKTGETVDPENYKITLQEGNKYSITFTEDFIRTLKPGKNDFVMTWQTGRVLIRIIIM